MFCSEYEITECVQNYAAMIVINNVKKDVKSKNRVRLLVQIRAGSI